MDAKQCSLQYLIATKFIDDKLLRFVNQIDGLKQVISLRQETKNDYFLYISFKKLKCVILEFAGCFVNGRHGHSAL